MVFAATIMAVELTLFYVSLMFFLISCELETRV